MAASVIALRGLQELTAETVVAPSAAVSTSATFCLTLLAAAIVLAVRGRAIAASVPAAIVIAIAALVGAEMAFEVDLGIDHILYRDPTALGTPGRMGANTAIAVLLLALSVPAAGERRAWLGQALALGAGTIALLAVLGYANGVRQLTEFAGLARMSAPTALGIVA